MLPHAVTLRFYERILALTALLLIAFFQFYRLGDLPVVQWDESRLAVNAAEMSLNGPSLITRYENAPDLYNTKPPLMIWLQAASIRVFGMNELALRMPSALAGLLCIVFCGFIVYRHSSRFYLAVFASLLLAASDGFIQIHGSLTGDYDALLSLFVLLSMESGLQWLQEGKRSQIVSFTLFLALAIFSKSAAGMLLLPVLCLIAMLQHSFTKALRLIVAGLLATLPFLLFCVFRELSSPGYLEAIRYNDFSGRFSGIIDGHDHAWYYYIVNLFAYRFNGFIWLLPAALPLLLLYGNKRFRAYPLVFLLYLGLLSVARTRIHWYDMPLLPVVSICISLFLAWMADKIKKDAVRNTLFALVWLTLLWPLAQKAGFIFRRSGLPLDLTHYELSEMLRKHPAGSKALYLAAPYDAEFYFYTLSRPGLQRGQFASIPDSSIVYHGNLYRDSIRLRYQYQTIDSTTHARKIIILGKH